MVEEAARRDEVLPPADAGAVLWALGAPLATDRLPVAHGQEAEVALLPVGDGVEVEVWCRSLQRWVDGYELVALRRDEAGRLAAVIRRRSDGHVLPALFTPDDVRLRPPADRRGHPSVRAWHGAPARRRR